MVRTRFAPSPTGSLHVGNARIAVLDWLFARQNDGVFVLRIEDTDARRNVAGAEARILDDLRWLGLAWDEGPQTGTPTFPGPNAPYRQSERARFYAEYAEWLIAAGCAYPCYCSPDELEAHRAAALAAGGQPHYPGTCRDLTAAEIAEHERAGRVPAVRFRVPAADEPVVVQDAVRGAVRFDRAEIGDFVLLRSDGRPTYNFGVVVDDILMEVTHVIRGSAHLSNTPRQVLLFEAIGHPTPVFAHVPMVLGPDRQTLSKRHGARSLADYRREGYHPDALVNYLSLLSWSSPDGEEFLTREQLLRDISLERIRASDVVFDPAKLRWLSARHIEAMPIGALVAAVSPFVDRDRFPISDDALPIAVRAVRTHLATFGDIAGLLAPFVATRHDAAVAARSELRCDDAARTTLAAVRDALAALDPWDEAAVEEALKRAGRTAGARGRDLFMPVRLALTGEEHGPPLPALLSVVGRAESLRILSETADDRAV